MKTLILVSPSPLEKRRYFHFFLSLQNRKQVDLFFESHFLYWRAADLGGDVADIMVVVNGNRLPDRMLVWISMRLRFDVLILQHGVNLSMPLSKESISKLGKQFPKYARWIIGTIIGMLWLARIGLRRAFVSEKEVKKEMSQLSVWAYTEEYLSYWKDRIPLAAGRLLPAPDPRTYGALNNVANSREVIHGKLAIFVDELYEETYGLNHRFILAEAVKHSHTLGAELVVKLHPRSPQNKYAAQLKKQALVSSFPENVSFIYGYESSLLKLTRCDAKFRWDPSSNKFRPYHYDAAPLEGDYESSVLEHLSAI